MICRFCCPCPVRNVMAEEQLWIFSGFDIVDGKSKAMNVPRVGGPTHAVTQTSFQFQSYTGGITPEPDVDRDFATLVSDSYSFKKKYSEAQVRDLVKTVLGYENPDRHNPGTLDCASCHMANMAYQWAKKHYPQFLWESEFREAVFTSVWNLNNSSRTDVVRPNQLRAFGYFGKDPAISQRVINETAAVADSLVVSPEKL